jgi:Cu(I)/Ag(I) efflux system membrane fusion protein
MPVYRIADLSHLWLIVSVHERDLPFIALGQHVEVEVSGLAQEKFRGRVSFLDPVLDDMTRTARVRVEVPNSAGRLKPGMFGTAIIFAELASDGTLAQPAIPGEYACPMHPLQRSSAPGACPICGMALKRRVPGIGKPAGKILAVPREAVLSTGKRNLIYVEWWAKRGADGTVSHDHSGKAALLERPEYQGFEVRLGPPAAEFMDMPDGTKMKMGDFYPVLGGLPIGVRIVTNGQFLIDSQQELAGKPSLFRPMGGAGGTGSMPGMDH